jgi:hypothetical protein
MATLKVRIVRGFCIGTGRDVFPGDVVELNEAEARLRIAQGKATAVEDVPQDTETSGADAEDETPTVKTSKGRGR